MKPSMTLYGVCPRCEHKTVTTKPNCAVCGLWQPWGDEAIAARRAERAAGYHAGELAEESEWQKWRRDHHSDAAPMPWRFRLQALLHELRHRPALSVPAAALVAALIASTIITVRAVQPKPYNGATARCHDNTLSFARNHTGACSSHGGVRIFYK